MTPEQFSIGFSYIDGNTETVSTLTEIENYVGFFFYRLNGDAVHTKDLDGLKAVKPVKCLDLYQLDSYSQ